MGDFNFDYLTPDECKTFDRILKSYHLVQHVHQPTRITATSHSAIDLFITRQTNNSPLHALTVTPPFASDHSSVRVQIDRPQKQNAILKTQWMNYEGDFVGMNEAIETHDWTYITNQDTTFDEIFDDTMNTLTQFCNTYIPTKTYYLRPRDKPWFNNEIRAACRKRDRLHTKFVTSKNTRPQHIIDNHEAQWHAQRSAVNTMKRRAKRNFVQSQYNKINTTPQSSSDWWRIVKLCFGKSEPVPALRAGDGIDVTYANDPVSKANLLNDLFVSVTDINDADVTFPDPPPLTEATLDTISISLDDVVDSINDCPSNKSPGPDAISPYVLKQVLPTLAPMLRTLFNESLRRAIFPSELKRSNVTPIHKNGHRSEPKNYRPISLTSIISKVFEKAVLKHILEHLLSNNLLYTYQSGFLPNHSTTCQLLEIYHKLTHNLAEHLATTVLFADISRAFDRISHHGLKCKLRQYGFSDNLRDWIYSFLTGRVQRTYVGGHYSDWKELKGGVPQGSVLGPALFLLYINDLPQQLDNDSRLFADDTSIMFTHRPDYDATNEINADLVKLSHWAKTWLVDLHPAKTKAMLVTLAHNPLIPSPILNGTPVEFVNSHKHLGLVLNSRCTWHDHIELVKNKVASRIGVLRSLKHRLNRDSLLAIYKTYIRSSLEYCNVVWHNCTAGQAEELEVLQRDCIRIITGLSRFCLNDHLYTESGLETLESRRHRQRLIMLFKIVRMNCTPTYLQTLLPQLRNNPNVRNDRHTNTFLPTDPPRIRLDTYLTSFFPGATTDWNVLDVSVRSTTSLGRFKRLLTPELTVMYPLAPTPRYTSIIYTRLKYECSSLNSHVHHANIIDSPICQCGNGPETNFHYFYDCPFHDVPREVLMYELDQLGLQNLSLPILLHCDRHNPELSYRIQLAVYHYIHSTRRFTRDY